MVREHILHLLAFLLQHNMRFQYLINWPLLTLKEFVMYFPYNNLNKLLKTIFFSLWIPISEFAKFHTSSPPPFECSPLFNVFIKFKLNVLGVKSHHILNITFRFLNFGIHHSSCFYFQNCIC